MSGISISATLRSSRRLNFVLLVLFAVVSASNAFSSTIKAKWIGTVGVWSDSTKWSTGTVPNNAPGFSYDVSINSPFATGVWVNTNNTVNSVFVGQHNQLAQGPGVFAMTSLRNNGEVDIGGTFVVNGNVVNNSGIWPTFQDGIIVSGNLLVNGLITNRGEISLWTDSTGSISGSLLNTGGIDLVNGVLNLRNVVNTGYIRSHGGPGVDPGPPTPINMQSLTNSGILSTGLGSNEVHIGNLNNLRRGNIDVTDLSSNRIDNAGLLSISDTPGLGALPVIGSLYNSQTGSAGIGGYGWTIGSVRNAGQFTAGSGSFSGFPDAYIGRLDNLASGTFHAGNVNIGSFRNLGTTLADGILRTSSLTNLGHVTVSPTGQILIGTGPDGGAGLTQYATSILTEQILSSSHFGTMNIAGPVSLDGTLSIVRMNSFLPTAGESFVIADFAPGQLTGTWASVLGLNFDNGLFSWIINYDNAQGEIILTAQQNSNVPSPVPEPATWFMILSGAGAFAIFTWRWRFRRS